MTDYSPEELLPVFSRIVQRYTSNESSSIPYAKAQQLMGSILYCINGIYDENLSLPVSSIPAHDAYQMGFKKRKEKVELARQIYRQILDDYLPLGNEFCDDTILKGIPVFFERYDLEFHAQDHLLTLDYPLHENLEGLTGIDMIYAYLSIFLEEQKVLSRYPIPVLVQVLKEYHPDYKTIPLNMYSIILERTQRCDDLTQNSDKLTIYRQGKDSFLPSVSFEDGQMLPDDQLRAVLDEIQSCRHTSDKLSLIRECIHSLADLKEVLKECIWPDEYSVVFSMLSPLEMNVLLDEIIAKQDFGQTLCDWESAVLDYE